MTPEELRDSCLVLPGVRQEFPFGPETSVFKIGKKMFALSRLDAAPLQVSVKCEPLLAESLRAAYASIVPGYHLNKRHWITVTLNEDADDRIVRDLVQDSYDLVKPRQPRPRP